MIKRLVTPRILRTQRSILLLGPRQTGKSTLMRSLRPVLSVNLAREREYLPFARNPGELEARLGALSEGMVLLDEVQRLPSLLNTVQAIIDEMPGRYRFLITGSSARKLRRGQANLLPGRTIQHVMSPLLVPELPPPVDLATLLGVGSLPGIWTTADADERQDLLSSYASIYVKEEIQAEALTRNLEGFSRFLYVAAASVTRTMDISKISSEAAIARTSVGRYLQILEDTLIFFRLEPYATSAYRRLIKHPRYFVFDNGVLNALLGSYEVGDDRKGMLFENLVTAQIYHLLQTLGLPWRLSFYRTAHGAEVDLIVESSTALLAIEMKASQNVGRPDLRGLASFCTLVQKPVRCWVIYTGHVRKVLEGVELIPWETALRELGEMGAQKSLI